MEVISIGIRSSQGGRGTPHAFNSSFKARGVKSSQDPVALYERLDRVSVDVGAVVYDNKSSCTAIDTSMLEDLSARLRTKHSYQ
jgi:hypothetical protein